MTNAMTIDHCSKFKMVWTVECDGGVWSVECSCVKCGVYSVVVLGVVVWGGEWRGVECGWFKSVQHTAYSI